MTGWGLLAFVLVLTSFAAAGWSALGRRAALKALMRRMAASQQWVTTWHVRSETGHAFTHLEVTLAGRQLEREGLMVGERTIEDIDGYAFTRAWRWRAVTETERTHLELMS